MVDPNEITGFIRECGSTQWLKNLKLAIEERLSQLDDKYRSEGHTYGKCDMPGRADRPTLAEKPRDRRES